MQSDSRRKHKIISNQLNIKTQNVEIKADKIEFINGYKSNYGLIDHPGSSMIIAINNKHEMILLSQYRFSFSDYIYEFPSGTIQKGETALTAAKRELLEETGLESNEWNQLGLLYEAPSYSNELIHLFTAKNLSKANENYLKDEDEFIKVLSYNQSKISAMINNNEIKDSATISCFYKMINSLT